MTKTTGKTKATKVQEVKLTDAQVIALRTAVTNDSDAFAALIAAVKDCGGPDVLAVRLTVVAQRVLRKLSTMWQEGRKKPLSDAELWAKALRVARPDGEELTAAEKSAAGDGRKYWSRVRAQFDIARTDNRGGRPRKEETDAPQAGEQTLIPAGSANAPGSDAKPVTAEAAREFIRTQAAMLDAFARKHAALLGLHTKEAVAAFYKAITSNAVELPEAAPEQDAAPAPEAAPAKAGKPRKARGK